MRRGRAVVAWMVVGVAAAVVAMLAAGPLAAQGREGGPGGGANGGAVATAAATPAAAGSGAATRPEGGDDGLDPRDVAFRAEVEGLAREFRALQRASRAVNQQLDLVREEVRIARRLEDAIPGSEERIARQLDLLLGRHGAAALSHQPFRQAVRFVVAVVGLLVLRMIWKIRRSRLRGDRAAASAAATAALVDDPAGTSGAGRILFVLLLLTGGLVVSALWDASAPLGRTETADLQRLNDIHREVLDLQRREQVLTERIQRVLSEAQRLRDLQASLTQSHDEIVRRSTAAQNIVPPAAGGGPGVLEIVLVVGGVAGALAGMGLWRAARRPRRGRAAGEMAGARVGGEAARGTKVVAGGRRAARVAGDRGADRVRRPSDHDDHDDHVDD